VPRCVARQPAASPPRWPKQRCGCELSHSSRSEGIATDNERLMRQEKMPHPALPTWAPTIILGANLTFGHTACAAARRLLCRRGESSAPPAGAAVRLAVGPTRLSTSSKNCASTASSTSSKAAATRVTPAQFRLTERDSTEPKRFVEAEKRKTGWVSH
jgi:hypothetical protein